MDIVAIVAVALVAAQTMLAVVKDTLDYDRKGAALNVIVGTAIIVCIGILVHAMTNASPATAYWWLHYLSM